ncbi:MAG: bifunctional hydroxymethylpyrimidine kinase/phosphomethylpyrimidine kinase [Solirubrobacterales bacterium]|nr:MAG: bifunctional hydroxymethylpyrimidine kinase/phosphomethylpyrimidine kinase [Solirubrobacterales bacterium]
MVAGQRPLRTPRVLAIAGSDSGGGAGIQADLKAFARCGVHGMTAITAITAQNTVAVTAMHAVPAEMVVGQVRAVVEDIGVDAVKIGMPGTRESVAAVARALDLLAPGTPIVLDPVMVAESGAALLEPDAVELLTSALIPRATVITPNIPEAGALVGRTAARPGAELEELATALLALGPGAVIVTGGHRGGEDAVDLFLSADGAAEIRGQRFPEGAAHGSGCTHSSALAAHLALGFAPLEAARRAHVLAAQAVRDGLRDIGAGAGPVDAIGLTRRW